MVLQVFAAPKKRDGPIINESGYHGSTNYLNTSQISSRIITEIRNMPELVGILDTVITDHFLGDIDYYAPDGLSSLGPTQMKRAMKFWADNNVMRIFQGLGMDYFVGDAYAWAPTLNNQNPSAIKEMSQRFPSLKAMIDEEGSIPRKFGYVPGSSVTIKYGLTDIEYYEQNSQGVQIRFSPQEIVHLKCMEFNGEVAGMSGLKALAREVAMMYMLKENIIAQLDNGGVPDNIIFLKDGTRMSKAQFDRLRLSLESFSHIKKSHGNLAIDGDVGVHQLGVSLKDMEYRELAMFVVSEFLLAIGLPTTRVPFLMTGSGGAANKGNLAGDSEQSYQKKVNSRRLQWEHALNGQVFNKLGFSFKFRRDNLQDEVRETQATQMRYQGINDLLTVLQKSGKQLTQSSLLDMLSGVKKRILETDLEDFKMDPIQQAQQDAMGQSPKINGPKNNVQEANSRARVDNATNRGVNA